MADAVLYGQTGSGEKQICPSFTGNMELHQISPDRGYALLTTSGVFSWKEGSNSDIFGMPYKKPSLINVYVLGGGGGASGTAGAVRSYYSDATGMWLPVKISHGAGGGSGYLTIQKKIDAQQNVTVVIGAGGSAGNHGHALLNGSVYSIVSTPTAGSDGGQSSFGEITANGGVGGGISGTLTSGGTIYDPPLTPAPANGGNGNCGGGPGSWILIGSSSTNVIATNPNKDCIGGLGGTNGESGSLAAPTENSGIAGNGSGVSTIFYGLDIFGYGGNGGGVGPTRTTQGLYGFGGDGGILGTTRASSGPGTYREYYDWKKLSAAGNGGPGLVVVTWGDLTADDVSDNKGG